jgi:hypothetical protein
LAGTFDECGGTQTITWTFTDDCGRTITHVQTITIDPAPQAAFVNPPADITLTCDDFRILLVTDLTIPIMKRMLARSVALYLEYWPEPLMNAVEHRPSPGPLPMIAEGQLRMYKRSRLILHPRLHL